MERNAARGQSVKTPVLGLCPAERREFKPWPLTFTFYLYSLPSTVPVRSAIPSTIYSFMRADYNENNA